MIRVLFVCLGNICRSPMAEAVFRQKVRHGGLEDKIQADSAGTGHWHVGEMPHVGTRKVLESHGVVYTHRARQLTARDLDEFDYILAMDDDNIADITSLGAGRAKVARFLEYAPHLGVRSVPDPYYTGGFDEVYRLLTAAAEGLLIAIRAEQTL